MSTVTVGEWIADRRKYRRLSQKQLAKKLGVTPVYLCYLERGTRRLTSLKMIYRIASCIGVNAAYLAGECMREFERKQA